MKPSLLRIAFFICLSPLMVLAQGKNYTSKEESRYIKTIRAKGFEPASIEVIHQFSPNYLNLINSADSISKKEINSIDSSSDKAIKDFEKRMGYKPWGDSAKKAFKEFDVVCSSTNSRRITATLFLRYKYDQVNEGYWIRLEDGSSSREYYLGFTQYNYLRLFHHRKSIWKNDSTLQFRAARSVLRQTFIASQL